MLPAQLRAANFAAYPPLARDVALRYLGLLQQLPAVFAAILLREIIRYDWKFPAERTQMNDQLRFLSTLSQPKLADLMSQFSAIPLSTELKDENWAASPAEFIEQFTAYLWIVHAVDSFRTAAESYRSQLSLAVLEQEPATPRLCIVVIGKQADPNGVQLFRKLRAHGTYFTQIKSAGGLDTLMAAVAARASSHPQPYAHWYVDGGTPRPLGISVTSESALVQVSYDALEPLRNALLAKVHAAVHSGTVGPEALRSMLARLKPQDLGDAGLVSTDPILNHFDLTLFTEGSGTQVFSTTFVQWAAREILRRAQPLTLIARYSPRQREQPMNELLTAGRSAVQYDPAGSLIDADLGAYYTWLNLQRLPGAEKSIFLAWWEDQPAAMVVAPTMPKGTRSENTATLAQLVQWIT
jgi:hypothetical protein